MRKKITDGKQNKFVDEKDLDTWLQSGWRLGWYNQQEQNEKNREQNKLRWEQMSEGEKQQRNDKISNTLKQYHKSLTNEDINKMNEKRLMTRSLWTNDEKCLYSKKMSESAKKDRLSRTPEQIMQSVAKGWKTRHENKSDNMTQLEKRLEQFLISNQFNYTNHYLIKQSTLSHVFDFAIFDKYDNLSMLIDTDGLYFHGYYNDDNGRSVNTYTDEYRQLLVPKGVKFIVILEGKEEKGYEEILKLQNISYSDYIQYVYNWCRECDFPYPKYEDNVLSKSYEMLCKSDISCFSNSCRYGDKIINHFHPSIWHCNKKGSSSPFDAWNNDTLLMKAIKNRIIYKGSSLDRSRVLSGLSASGVAPKVSIFNANLAKYLTEKYLHDFKSVYDPFSGYSGRMLGVCASGRQYFGFDINEKTVCESQNIINHFQLNACVDTQDLLTIDSVVCDCVLTCPPYKDKEHWCKDIQNMSCDEWMQEVMKRYKAKRYVFVIDETQLYKQFVVEQIRNKSHFNASVELVVVVDG